MTEEEQIRLARSEIEVDNLSRRLRALANQHTAEIEALRRDFGQANRLAGPPDPERTPSKRVFHAQITGFNPTSGTPYLWRELYTTSAAIGAFASGRSCTSLLSGGTAVELNGWKFIPSATNVEMIEYRNISRSRFVFCATLPAVPNPNVAYVLGYASATKQLKWYTQDDCS